jgi:hypothetical protein
LRLQVRLATCGNRNHPLRGRDAIWSFNNSVHDMGTVTFIQAPTLSHPGPCLAPWSTTANPTPGARMAAFIPLSRSAPRPFLPFLRWKTSASSRIEETQRVGKTMSKILRYGWNFYVRSLLSISTYARNLYHVLHPPCRSLSGPERQKCLPILRFSVSGDPETLLKRLDFTWEPTVSYGFLAFTPLLSVVSRDSHV